jgi:hypothetical protein
VLEECASKAYESIRATEEDLIFACYFAYKKMFLARAYLEHMLDGDENPF